MRDFYRFFISWLTFSIYLSVESSYGGGMFL